MDLDKLRELAVAHLPVPVETAQIAHETYCPRIGGPVELYDGTCPECGWRYCLTTHSAVSVHPEDLHALIEEVDRLRARAEKAESNYAFMVERANVDRWQDGYAAAERQIAAWLGQPCGMSGHDDRWCPACSFRADIANAVRDGKHRPANRENP